MIRVRTAVGIIVGALLFLPMGARGQQVASSTTSSAASAPEWCVGCDEVTGSCELTYGVSGFYKCENVDGGCLLTKPGCGGTTAATFELDGSARSVVASALNPVATSLTRVAVAHGEALIASCNGAVFARMYSADAIAEMKAATAVLVL